MARSRLFGPATLEEIPPYKKIAVRTARLFSPIL